MAKITKAQDELLRKLENGYEITFSGGHYMTTYKDQLSEAKLWPSTFYGLFDGDYVEKLENGNYTVSASGKKQIRGKVT